MILALFRIAPILFITFFTTEVVLIEEVCLIWNNKFTITYSYATNLLF